MLDSGGMPAAAADTRSAKLILVMFDDTYGLLRGPFTSLSMPDECYVCGKMTSLFLRISVFIGAEREWCLVGVLMH